MRRFVMLGVMGLLGLAGCERKQPEAKPEPAAKSTAPEVAMPSPAPMAKPIASKSGGALAEAYRRCNAAWSSKDEATYTACWSEQGTSEAVDLSPAVTGTGKEIVDKMARPSWQAFPDVTAESRLILVNGRSLAAIDRYTGTNTGELHGMPATGKKATYYIAHVVDLDAQGRIVRSRGYGDMGSLMSQLGQGPPLRRPLVETGWTSETGAVAGDTPLERSNAAAVEKMRTAFNAHDVAGGLAIMADGVVVKSYGSQEEWTGKKAVEKAMKELVAAFPDARIDVTDLWAAGDWVVETGTLIGTNLGDMPAWKLKKSGKPVRIGYVELFRFEKGKLAELHRFFNGMAFAKQLGMMPPEAKGKKPGGS
jgi:predicted ester cyclase